MGSGGPSVLVKKSYPSSDGRSATITERPPACSSSSVNSTSASDLYSSVLDFLGSRYYANGVTLNSVTMRARPEVEAGV